MRDMGEEKRPGALIDMKKAVPHNKAYILDVKACLNQAKKRRGIANNHLEMKLRESLQLEDRHSIASGTDSNNYRRDDPSRAALIQSKLRYSTKETLHDVSYKDHDKSKIGNDKNDPGYRAWLKDKLRKINTDELMNPDFKVDSFVDQFLISASQEKENSMQKALDQTKVSTLVGPGSYDVNYSQKEAATPAFTFDRETTQIFDTKTYTNYLKENQQIAVNRASRLRNSRFETIKREWIDKNSKQQLLAELVETVEEGGEIDREDAALLI